MRLSKTKVMQLIEKGSREENTIVIVDEKDGTEIELTQHEFMRLADAVVYYSPYLHV